MLTNNKYFNEYFNKYGPHFNEALSSYAVGMMRTNEGLLKAFTKDVVEQKLNALNIKLKNKVLCDAVYVANMCKADFLGHSVPDDDWHLCAYIEDVLDDPDGFEGQPFFRWLSDMAAMKIDIDWSKYV